MIGEILIPLKNIYEILKQDTIDEIQLKKNIYQLIKACIKTKQYEISIGEYQININPEELMIKKELEETLIEINREEIYYETERETDIRFYCITDKKEKEYSLETPTIQVQGHVMNIKNHKKAEYILTVLNNEKLNIRNYIINNNIAISNINTAIIELNIDNKTPIIDLKDYLDYTKVVPVYLDYKNNKYITDIPFIEPKTYQTYLPNINKEIIKMKKIYNCIIEFYNEYSTKELFQ